MFDGSSRHTGVCFMICLGLLFVTYSYSGAAMAAPAPPPAKQAPQSDPACKPAVDALDKLWTTPYHMFMTETGTAHKTPKNSETISAGGAHYVNINGKWIKSPVSLKGMQETEQENREKNKTSCHNVREEAVGTEAAVVYSVHEEHSDPDDPNDVTKTDSMLWISKSSGLVLRSDINIVGGGIQQHISNRYEYTNVHAPAL